MYIATFQDRWMGIHIWKMNCVSNAIEELEEILYVAVRNITI